MTDITELAKSLKAAAEKAGIEQWVNNCGEVNTADYEVDGGMYIDHICNCEIVGTESPRAEFIALANPANILALVEALENANRYIERLREWNAGLAQESCERQQLISELEPIRAAAEKLVRCKGRYHSEQNYRALAALFGVKTPDLPPLEHENVHYADAAEMEIAALRQRIAELESRTVKLPDLRQIVSGDRYVWSDGVYNYSQDVKVALAAAGIKVEAE
ncbi:TPA: ead/Ea22-like family protein [Klebsiella pneumoniae]